MALRASQGVRARTLMLNPGAWSVHPELPRSVQGGRLYACSAAAIQICRLDASDGGAYRCLPPRFICGAQEGLELQEQYGIGYARSLIEQIKDGFANYCVRQPFVLVSVHGDLLVVSCARTAGEACRIR